MLALTSRSGRSSKMKLPWIASALWMLQFVSSQQQCESWCNRYTLQHEMCVGCTRPRPPPAPALAPIKTAVNTAPWPRVFLIGVQKGGTTSITDVFARVGLCAKEKESHYFDHLAPCNLESDECSQYVAGFTAKHPAGTGIDCTYGSYEGTPAQLSDAGLPHFLAKYYPAPLMPALRIMVSIREPVSRFYSAFHHVGSSGRGATFEANAKIELKLWRENASPCAEPVREPPYGTREWRSCFHESYCQASEGAHIPCLQNLMRGLYHLHLSRWRKHLPRKQLLILNMHDMMSHQTDFMWRLATFLSVPPLATRSIPRWNANGASHDPMCCETYCEFQNTVYGEENAKLFSMMDNDFHQHAGPAVEPRFGRFPVPTCQPCAHPTVNAALASCSQASSKYG